MPYVGNTYYDDDIYQKYFIKLSKAHYIQSHNSLIEKNQEISIHTQLDQSINENSVNQLQADVSIHEIYQNKEQIEQVHYSRDLLQPEILQQQKSQVPIPSLSLVSIRSTSHKLPPPRLFTARKLEIKDEFESQMEQILDSSSELQRVCQLLFKKDLTVQFLYQIKQQLDNYGQQVQIYHSHAKD
uniref:Uncharacterized protein n=1 Tax=Spironucleus salmonicida TaxID=348837 RepID=V6LB63_9EUKA|eukprot:EST41665.1 Hypothetical protein SS50377_18753 [Spironucleus salmonicida]